MTINVVTKIYTIGDLKTYEIATVEELLVKSEVKTLPKTNAVKEVKQLVNKKEVVEGVLSGHTVKVTVKYQVEELVKVEDTVKPETNIKDKDIKAETGGAYSPKDVIKPENIDKPTPKDDVKPLPPTIDDLELPKPKPEQPKGEETPKTDDEKLVDEINKENEKEKDKEVLPEKPKGVETPEVPQPEGEKPSVEAPKTDDTVKPEAPKTEDTVKPEGEKPSTEVTPERTPVYGAADYNWQPTYKNLDKNEPFELYAKYDLLEFNKSMVKYINQYAKPSDLVESGAIDPTTLLTDLPSEAANEEEAQRVLHNYSFRAYELAKQVGSSRVNGVAHVWPEGPDNEMIAGENTAEFTDIVRPGEGNDFRGAEDKIAHIAVRLWAGSDKGHRESMEEGSTFISAFDYNPYTKSVIVTLNIN